MNPNAVTTAPASRKRGRSKATEDGLFFSWKLSAENATDGSAAQGEKRRGSGASLDEAVSRPAQSNPIPTGVVGARKEEGEEEGAVNLEDIIAEARRLATTEELRDANQEEYFLPLSEMFELHPLGTGLGEKLQKGEQILEPVRLMNRLEPNLTKYERRIQEKREKERRREMLLAQLVALHDHSKRLQEERQQEEQELEIRPHHHNHQAASSGALVPFSTSSTDKGKDKAEVPPHPHTCGTTYCERSRTPVRVNSNHNTPRS